MAEFEAFRWCSFPHGRNVIIILSILCSLIGLGITIAIGTSFQSVVVKVCLGLVVVTSTVLITSMKLSECGLILASMASFSMAAYHYLEMRSTYKFSQSLLLCNHLAQLNDDAYASMEMSDAYKQHSKYCGTELKRALALYGVAIFCWILAGSVLTFLATKAKEQQEEPLMNDAADEPATEYQKQLETNKNEGGTSSMA